MPDTHEAKIHCAHLNGSDGFSCDVIGPYTHDRKKPTQARIADGPVERLQGHVNMPHLRCIPALEKHAHREGPDAITYKELVRRQSDCSHYEEIDVEAMREALRAKIQEADEEFGRRLQDKANTG